MLFSKPVILYYQHKKKTNLGSRLNDRDSLSSIHLSVNGEENEKNIINSHQGNVILLEKDEEEKVIILLRIFAIRYLRRDWIPTLQLPFPLYTGRPIFKVPPAINWSQRYT